MNYNDLIINVILYLNNNLNNNIKINDLEKKFNYNGSYIMRMFKKEMDFTVVYYINSMKILNSFEMLINTNDSILKIALENGFNSLEYFSETFKNITGFNPLYFRKMLASKDLQEIIIHEINRLQDIKEKADDYCYSKEKKENVKKLTIFKH